MNVTEKDALVGDALRALLYEVSVNPKPGLVDPVSSGPHPDMDVFTFIDSSMSLRRYFSRCVEQGTTFQGDDLRALFLAIRPAGVEAEKAMFEATKGVNTHKGAIFPWEFW
jgi:Triphosphoribosyl-dephospho-CoA synthetase